ncbi:MAG: T9SS type A sorting domain-containing protein [Candidatus Marinimicrobia bacterium]|nr:T9SS type A sorting domain-containing protein [Candidatus Neomarinimicrobiota bacterium]
MLNKSKQFLTILLMSAFTLTGGALAQGMGGGGHDGGHGGGNGGGGGCNPDSLVIIELSGTVLIDSVAWGFQMDSTGGCGNWDSTFAWGHGNGSHGPGAPQHEDHELSQAYAMVDRETQHEGDSLRAIYYLDTDADGIEDYVLNFGPYWYTPEDSTLARPEAGDEITVSGALMEDSPMWDMDVIVVTILNGSEWRELGSMHGGGMLPRRSALAMPFIGRHENSPNPFNPTTMISVELLQDADLNVSIYDLKGRLITNLVNQRYTRGDYQFMWDGTSQAGISVPSGVYIYTIQSGNNMISSQITMLK